MSEIQNLMENISLIMFTQNENSISAARIDITANNSAEKANMISKVKNVINDQLNADNDFKNLYQCLKKDDSLKVENVIKNTVLNKSFISKSLNESGILVDEKSVEVFHVRISKKKALKIRRKKRIYKKTRIDQ